MDPTLANREAIQRMKDAGGPSQDEDDHADLMTQVILDAAQQPKSIRSASGEEITNRDMRDVIAAHQYSGRQSSPFRTVQLIPGGCG